MKLDEFLLGKKLHKSFVFMTVFSVVLITFFSIFYFSSRTRKEAVSSIQKSAGVMDYIYRNEVADIAAFAGALKESKMIASFDTDNISKKLEEYMSSIIGKEKNYAITLFNPKFEIITEFIPKNSLLKNHGLSSSLSNSSILENAVKTGRVASGSEIIDTEKSILSITSVVPIFRDKYILGYLLVRNILNNNENIFNTIAGVSGSEVTVYHNAKKIAGNGENSINISIYNTAMLTKGDLLLTPLLSNRSVSVYKKIFDIHEKPIAICRVSMSATAYFLSIIGTSVIFLVLMVVTIALTYLLIVINLKEILAPINGILYSETESGSRDLNAGMILELKNELQKFNTVLTNIKFNLNGKLTMKTEYDIIEKTKAIRSLMLKMKKDIGQDLYEAIVNYLDIRKYLSIVNIDDSTIKEDKTEGNINFDMADCSENENNENSDDIARSLNTALDIITGKNNKK